jgi:hypothetical protein
VGGFLWIREAGIPDLGNSEGRGAGLGFLKEFWGCFAQAKSRILTHFSYIYV